MIALHDGVYVSDANDKYEYLKSANDHLIDRNALKALATCKSLGMEITLYPKTGMGDGQQANNPWLQEFPDPLTRATWDNYLTVSEADAKELDFI